MIGEYEKVCELFDCIISEIKPYAQEQTVDDIQAIQKNFKLKMEDFHREGRKLNIGVIGRVKAGKSSFLNTLLFNGQEVLPKAATPKTATLTKMEYAEENKIQIEFYSKEEWSRIVEDSKFEDKNEITKSAKELVDSARNNGLDVDEILSRGNIQKNFHKYEDLIDYLNSYVGENGTYTPLVKAVVIYMNREEFKDVSIVDTPGLNDPIPSRTQRTKEFIEICDVVFFLSRSGAFLDENDWELLCKQLPQKGVKKLILIASQYDNGLRDVLQKKKKNSIFDTNTPSWAKKQQEKSKATDVPGAKKIVEESMQKRVRELLNTSNDLTTSEKGEMVLSVLRDCQKPIMISSRAHDMSQKEYENYTDQEKENYEFWKQYIPLNQMREELKAIGNFDEVREKYESVREEKQRLLSEKEKEFIPKVYLELEDYFCSLQKETKTKIDYLMSNDQASLEEEQRYFAGKINAIRADVAEIFGDTLESIKTCKIEVNQALGEMSGVASQMEVHTGSEYHGPKTTYKFKLGPIKLGKRTTSGYSTTYTYLAASDALEQITSYGKNAAIEINSTFGQVVEKKAFRRKLLESVIRNFDSSDNNFDANYFRIVVQNALNKIDFPEVKVDVTDEINDVGNKFSGEIRNSTAQEQLRRLLSQTINNMYQAVVEKVDQTIMEFKGSMEQIQEKVADDILAQVNQEFEKIKNEIDEKESEVRKGQEYLTIIDKILEEI